ncbi:MAG: alkaline phosphatase PhoX [Synechococcus sp.]|nr:alkaline phosphatase PhoX [Synechococcus sp.]
MALQRRQFVLLLGAGLGSLSLSHAGLSRSRPVARLPFQPLRTPLPLPSDGLSPAQQRLAYGQVELSDRLELPAGYTQTVLASWGDPVGEGRFGYNNDHLALRQLTADTALLTINFEYISPLPWRQGFAAITGQALPYAEVMEALASSDGRLDVWGAPASNDLTAAIRAVAGAALRDQGLGVIRLQRSANGHWQRQPGPQDRRIDGLSGLQHSEQLLRSSGPATAVFRLSQRRGYDDGLGDRIIGTFANCSGGSTPWGTVLSAEENFHSQVPEAVHADGSAYPPSARPFRCTERQLSGLGNPFGLAGNKYGWMVELDPNNPSDPGTKHTALGRFRHEAVAVKAQAGEPLVLYSGCDRRGGHLYRFESNGRINEPTDPRNSQLLHEGTLYGAVFHSDGRGEWRALRPDTAVDPLAAPVLVPHRDRSRGGSERLTSAADLSSYRQRFATLGDLYEGEGDAQLGALLIDAHLAANAAGITPTARPEDTVIDPASGDLLVSFTSGMPDRDGRPDPTIFKGPQGQTPWNEGWIMRLSEAGQQRFRWQLVATGGTPADGGLGFANPDNLAVDPGGALWMTTDIGTSSQNNPGHNGGSFGNNSCWVIPTSGAQAGEAHCFASGPMECELTGLALNASGDSLFLAVQHPGEGHGSRRNNASTTRAFALQLSNGEPLQQQRVVPLGSNWPSAENGAVPRPSVVVIQRNSGGPLLG